DTARAVRALESLKLLIVNLCRQYGSLDDKAHLYLTRTMELQREKLTLFDYKRQMAMSQSFSLQAKKSSQVLMSSFCFLSRTSIPIELDSEESISIRAPRLNNRALSFFPDLVLIYVLRNPPRLFFESFSESGFLLFCS